MESLAGTRCEASVDRPIAAATDDRASSTGMPAAMSAPNATIRIARVTGRLRNSARLKSAPRVSSRALPMDGPPTCSTRSAGCCCLHLGGGRAQRLHPVGGGLRVAAHGDRHQQRGAVGGGDRLADLRHTRAAPACGRAASRPPHRRRLVERAGAGGDQHIVDGRLVGEVPLLDHDAGAVRTRPRPGPVRWPPAVPADAARRRSRPRRRPPTTPPPATDARRSIVPPEPLLVACSRSLPF